MRAKASLLAFSTLLLGSGGLAVSQTGKAPSHAEELDREQHDAYLRLSNQIYSHEDPESQRVHLSDVDQVAEMVIKMRGIVQDRIARVLSSTSPTPAAITEAIKKVQGGLALSADPALDETNTPLIEFFELKGSRILTVAYTILRGGAGIPDTLPILEFYTLTDGKWELKETAPPDLTESRFFVRRMDAPLAGEVWYLTWGNKLGDPGARLSMRLYAFDGATVRTVWKRDDLSSGWMDEVTSKSIRFSYEKVYRSFVRTEETLYITPNGLQ